jgi:hypothetical protein
VLEHKTINNGFLKQIKNVLKVDSTSLDQNGIIKEQGISVIDVTVASTNKESALGRADSLFV